LWNYSIKSTPIEIGQLEIGQPITVLAPRYTALEVDRHWKVACRHCPGTVPCVNTPLYQSRIKHLRTRGFVFPLHMQTSGRQSFRSTSTTSPLPECSSHAGGFPWGPRRGCPGDMRHYVLQIELAPSLDSQRMIGYTLKTRVKGSIDVWSTIRTIYTCIVKSSLT